ncbi:2-dehydropantoate 2-reductase [Pseudonocardia oroxyli]|uniref:2-dehydropantoate 2-reductase n=1 Tax=Pseudonocardia oroxyli TaxID=366584 RepID=A0A1G7TJQ4_PSEOR|nr:2-dehydropantoate 2-reductase [Pseudonocardia oroxyli]SDG35557.1 ketopantoate reductase [Pseudonocardia oroxyli]
MPVATTGRVRPRCAVVGSGGIGAFFGAQVPPARGWVAYCARRPFTRLRVESEIGPYDARVHCLTDPGSVPTDWQGLDWVFVAVKAQHTRSAEAWLTRLCSPNTRVVSLQNGIEQRETITPLIRGAQLLETAVYCGAELRAPGLVHQRGQARVVTEDVPLAGELAELFAGTAVVIERSPDFRTEAWRKLMVNAAANGLTALTRKRMGVLQIPEVAELARAVMMEILPLARVEGARLSTEDVDRVLTTLRSPGSAEAMTSMYQDRLADRPTEHDAIYGAVARRAERLGVEAPLHRAIAALLTGAC